MEAWIIVALAAAGLAWTALAVLGGFLLGCSAARQEAAELMREHCRTLQEMEAEALRAAELEGLWPPLAPETETEPLDSEWREWWRRHQPPPNWRDYRTPG